MTQRDEAAAVAAGLDQAIRDRDVTALRALYADDAVVWHAATNRVQSLDENMAMLGTLFAEMGELNYVDIRRTFTDQGFVQQHRLVAKYKDGGAMPDVHACAVIQIKNNKITRLDEYFDMSEIKEHWIRLSQRSAAAS